MIAILSPAKTLDFETEYPFNFYSEPVFEERANYLAQKLSKLSARQLKNMMHISDDLAQLNKDRYDNWNYDDNNNVNKRQAIYAFKGEVYRGLQIESFSENDITYAQNHFRILSGLYGILKPMDLMQAYRLEMGTKWSVTKIKTNLYKYWGSSIANELNKELQEGNHSHVINLASQEYFKAIDQKAISVPIIDITFKDNKNGTYKVISVFAKYARGAFARFMSKSKAQSLDELKLFNEDGYAFDSNLSNEKELVFTR